MNYPHNGARPLPGSPPDPAATEGTAEVLLLTFAVTDARMRLVGSRYVGTDARDCQLESSSGSRQVQMLCRYLDEHFTQQHSLRALAERVRLDPSHLCRTFKRQTGRTITQYLRDRRIEAATTLLRESDHAITRIAGHIGFQDISNFNRSFKQSVGMSPRDYRKRERLDPQISNG